MNQQAETQRLIDELLVQHTQNLSQAIDLQKATADPAKAKPPKPVHEGPTMADKVKDLLSRIMWAKLAKEVGPYAIGAIGLGMVALFVLNFKAPTFYRSPNSSAVPSPEATPSAEALAEIEALRAELAAHKEAAAQQSQQIAEISSQALQNDVRPIEICILAWQCQSEKKKPEPYSESQPVAATQAQPVRPSDDASYEDWWYYFWDLIQTTYGNDLAAFKANADSIAIGLNSPQARQALSDLQQYY